MIPIPEGYQPRIDGDDPARPPAGGSSAHRPLKALGSVSPIPEKPSFSILEAIPFSSRDNLVVRLTCPEFTSLCPITGQPDFAHIVIDYAPREALVESKSIKLYLFSFRNHGEFHESGTRRIFDDLQTLLSPVWLRVAAFWYPRGGIPIDVVIQAGALNEGAKALPLDVPNYRGRG